MEDNKSLSINYIFYLQTKAELENSYYVLAEVLSQINISLLPIEAHDLKVIDRNKKNHLIVLRNDLASAFAFNDVRKSFLDVAMAKGSIAVYDLSSFSAIENAAKLENKSVYRFFQLPQNIKQVAMTVAVDFFKDRNMRAEWPGGKRAKLPSMTNES
jgi:hypothetical protein